MSNAAASVLASFHGDGTAFTATSAGLPSVERSFTSLSTAVAQVEDARVWGGIHFRFACVAAACTGAASPTTCNGRSYFACPAERTMMRKTTETF